jgi:hypothetical protein
MAAKDMRTNRARLFTVIAALSLAVALLFHWLER